MDDFMDSDGAIRVKEYYIYKAAVGRTKGIYHSSKYAEMKDEEWLAYKKETIEKANTIKDAIVDFDVN